MTKPTIATLDLAIKELAAKLNQVSDDLHQLDYEFRESYQADENENSNIHGCIADLEDKILELKGQISGK